jgi:hypothetical protein
MIPSDIPRDYNPTGISVIDVLFRDLISGFIQSQLLMASITTNIQTLTVTTASPTVTASPADTATRTKSRAKLANQGPVLHRRCFTFDPLGCPLCRPNLDS